MKDGNTSSEDEEEEQTTPDPQSTRWVW